MTSLKFCSLKRAVIFLFLPHHVIAIRGVEDAGSSLNSLTASVIQKLIKDSPLFLMLENKNSDLEILLRCTTIGSLYNIVHNLNLPHNNSEIVKPSSFPAKFTPYLWTFLFLIEGNRTEEQATCHLHELLKIGHPRLGRFLLVGSHNSIHNYSKVPDTIVDKFKNIIVSCLDIGEIYQRYLSRVLVRIGSENVSWITTKNQTFTGQHIRISGTRFAPLLDAVADSSKPGGWKVVGVRINIFQVSSSKFNFTFSFNPVNDWKPPGLRFPNGTWGGGMN